MFSIESYCFPDNYAEKVAFNWWTCAIIENMRVFKIVCMFMLCLTLAFAGLANQSSSSSFANNIKQPLNPIRVVHKIPPEVKKVTPQKAKTLYLGIYHIGNHRDILFHLYADSASKSPTAHLDLFRWEHKRFDRICSLKIYRPTDYLVPPGPHIAPVLAPFSIYGVQWLDMNHKSCPIIAVAAPDFRGYDEGKIHLFVFNKGLMTKPVEQLFDYYSDTMGAFQLLYFYSADGAGKTRILDYYQRTGGGPDYYEEDRKIYEWNGKKFVLQPASVKS